MTKPLQLVHLANFHSTNIGNGALISGLESTLAADLPFNISWRREAWDDYTFKTVDFDQTFVDKVNASDGLIVGGAVTFNARDYNDRTGTRFELPFALWPQVKKPIVFYGLSYRHWVGQPYYHLDKLRQFIDLALSSERILLTLRNDGTREWLSKLLGTSMDHVSEVPDSAVFVEAGEGTYTELSPDLKNVLISFNDEDAEWRYSPQNAPRSREHVVDQMVWAIEKLADEVPANFVLCPHYFDDYRMMSDFLKRIRPRIAHQRMVSTGLARVAHTGHFYGRYQKADLAISMRVHSMSPCVGLGTPMVAYTTQDRMTAFMECIGLPNRYVNAFDENAGQKLYERARHALEHGSEVRAELAAARQRMRNEAKAFHQRLANFLGGPRTS